MHRERLFVLDVKFKYKGDDFMPAYKDDKTGKWFAKFYYTDWQGNNKQKWKRGFTTKKEALTFEREFLEKQACNPDMTFNHYMKTILRIWKED